MTVPPVERASLATVPWLVGGLAASLPLLFVRVGDAPTGSFIVQLTILVVFALLLTIHLMRFGDEPWFAQTSWGPTLRSIASGVGLVVLVTGTVGLVTLASSAALRFDPSTQFLQLLSALDIAWVVAAVTIGIYRLASRTWAAVAGSAVGLFCVWSIWNYLSIVGFGANGEWIVSGSDLMRYVIPFDMAAAVAAVVAFLLGARTQVHATEQPRPQS